MLLPLSSLSLRWSALACLFEVHGNKPSVSTYARRQVLRGLCADVLVSCGVQDRSGGLDCPGDGFRLVKGVLFHNHIDEVVFQQYCVVDGFVERVFCAFGEEVGGVVSGRQYGDVEADLVVGSVQVGGPVYCLEAGMVAVERECDVSRHPCKCLQVLGN